MADTTDRNKRKRLGRGLSAMIEPSVPVAVLPPAQDAVGGVHAAKPRLESNEDGSYVHVLIGMVRPNRFQPRQGIDKDKLDELVASIRRTGVMQPIVVRAMDSEKYELVAGERRWRAAALAGLERIPAVIRVLSDADAAEWALIENMQREDLTAMERARAFRRLMDEFGVTQREVAQRLGISRPAVANMLRLLELDERIAALIESGELTAGHGKALLAIEDEAERLRLAQRMAAQGWSVRRAEEAVAGESGGPGSGSSAAGAAGAGAEPEIASLEKRLGEYLGTKVRIRTNKSGIKGSLSIEFYDLDHFDGLLQRIGFDAIGS